MLFENDFVSTDEWHFSSDIKNSEVPALRRIENKKITNRKPWEECLGILKQTDECHLAQ